MTITHVHVPISIPPTSSFQRSRAPDMELDFVLIQLMFKTCFTWNNLSITSLIANMYHLSFLTAPILLEYSPYSNIILAVYNHVPMYSLLIRNQRSSWDLSFR